MSKVVSIAEKQIIDSVTAALKTNMAEGTFIEAEIPDFKTEIPADKNNGDYSANAAFMLSKALRMPYSALPFSTARTTSEDELYVTLVKS
jgi:arginyl-tRNA synthetase